MSLEASIVAGRMTQTLTVDASIGLLDLVEAVFDRRPSTASFCGFHLPIENVIPEYTEVSSTINYLFLHRLQLSTHCCLIYLLTSMMLVVVSVGMNGLCLMTLILASVCISPEQTSYMSMPNCMGINYR